MTRIKTGTTRRKRHKKVLKQTKGHQGVRHRLYSRAKESLIHALKYSYAHRRKKKGDMRRLWTIRINAAVRANGLSYSQLMYGLRLKQVEINRKQLSELAVSAPDAFTEVVNQAKEGLLSSAA